jgi:pSer/pThr/pTyr-binding forkhead associated (FHA) protein
MADFEYNIGGGVKRAHLENGSYIFGRAGACDVSIREPSISSQHVRIDIEGEKVLFRDLLSRNGTFLNGVRRESGELREGDVLKLGKVELQVGQRHSVAPAPIPLDFSRDPHTNVDEETPPEMNFVPARVEPASRERAVEVVRPSAELVPVKQSVAAGVSDKKRKLLIAVAAAVCVVLAGLLLMPSTPPPIVKKPDVQYWPAVKDGVEAFRRGEYSKARQTWDEIDKAMKGAKPDSTVKAARVLAEAAQPFADYEAGKQSAPDWNSLLASLREYIDSGENSALDNFMQDLVSRCLKEGRAERQFQEAEKIRASGDLETAKAEYMKVADATMFYSRAGRRVEECVEEIYQNSRRAVLALAAGGDLQDAINRAQELMNGRDDQELLTLVGGWKVSLDRKRLLERIGNLSQSHDSAQLREAQRMIASLPDDDPAKARLLGRSEEIDRQFYLEKILNMYNLWAVDALLNEKENPLASRPEVQQLIDKAVRIKKLFDEADKELENKEYFKARELWDEVRALEGFNRHPANQKARDLLGEWSLEKLGELYRIAALEALHSGKYRLGRQRLTIASEKCRVDVEEEVKRFWEIGRKLLNQGLNKILTDGAFQGKQDILSARDCFLPTGSEEDIKWFDLCNKKYKDKIGEDPPPFK